MTQNYYPVPRVPTVTSNPTSFTHATTILELVDMIRRQLAVMDAQLSLYVDSLNDLVGNVNDACQSAIDVCTQLSTNSATLNSQTAAKIDTAIAALQAAQLSLQSSMSSAQQALTNSQTVLSQYQVDVAAQNAHINDISATLGKDRVPKGSIRFDVKDYGAVGDGKTDDTVSIQAAINAVGHQGVVIFTPGLYRITAPIVIPPDVIVEGVESGNYWTTRNGGEFYGIKVDFNPGTGGAINTGYNTAISRLAIYGQGSGTAITNSGSLTLTDVSIQNFDLALYLSSTYYGKFTNLKTNECALVVNSQFTHNLTFVTPQCMCSKNGVPGGFLDGAESRCEVKVMGGAIEGYRYAFMALGGSHVSCFGTYFEAQVVGGNDSIIWYARHKAQCVGVFIGCYIYVGNHSRIFDMYGDDTKCTLVSMGNYFNGTVTNPGYVGIAWSSENGKVNITAQSDMYTASGGPYFDNTIVKPGNSIIMNPLNWQG